jgi:diguanylate cyclase (GGDEF)-like protein
MSSSQLLLRRTAMVRRVLDVLPQEIALIDRDGTITWVNDSWRSFAADNAGPVGAAMGWNYLEVCRRAVELGEPVARHVLGALTIAVEGGDPGPASCWEYTCHGPGAQRWFQVSVRPLADTPARETAFRLSGAVVVHEDITARVLAQRAYRRRAVEDPMTGLANELLFLDRAAHAISSATRHGRRVGVVLIDIPGADAVDESSPPRIRRLVRGVGRRIRAELRAYDLVARWSAGTLAIIVESVGDLAELAPVAARLARLVAVMTASTAADASADAPPTPPLGIAISHPSDTAQDVLTRAEAALARSRAGERLDLVALAEAPCAAAAPDPTLDPRHGPGSATRLVDVTDFEQHRLSR